MTDPSGPKRKAWQVAIRTLALLMAAIALWLSVFINRRESDRLRGRIAAMEPLAHELKVVDPSKFAAVRKGEIWMDDNRWDLYLPPGEYRINVRTRQVPKNPFGKATPGGPAPQRVATLKGGLHRLELGFKRRGKGQGEGWHFRVTDGDSDLLAFDEPKDWAESGSSIGGGQFSETSQRPVDQPLVLYERRSMSNAGGEVAEPVDGLLMWIEKVDAPKPR